MASAWFAFNESDGGLRGLERPARNRTPRPWTERTMESLLGLNPELVGAGDCLPLFLHGGQSGADQAYIDELGRLTIVEIKAREATERDLVQALSYGYHLPSLSLHDHARVADALSKRAVWECGLRILEVIRPDQGLRDALSCDRMTSVSRKVDELGLAGGQNAVRKLAATARRRLALQANREEALDAFGKRLWGEHAFDLVGTPPVIVLVAPKFSDECKATAARLVERWVNLRLVGADMWIDEDTGQVLVEREEVLEGRPQMDRVWRALAEIWKDAAVRSAYRPACWYMTRPAKEQRAYLELTAAGAPGAEMWLSVNEDGSEGGVDFKIRHSYYEDLQQRAKLARELERRLPEGGGRGSSFWWGFALPKKNAQWIECAKTVAKVGADVLADAGGHLHAKP